MKNRISTCSRTAIPGHRALALAAVLLLGAVAAGCSNSNDMSDMDGEDIDQMSPDDFAVRYAEAICSAADFAVSCTDTAGCTVPADGDLCRTEAKALVTECFVQADAESKWNDLQVVATECMSAAESINSCDQVGLRFDPVCTELTETTESAMRVSCLRMIDMCDSLGRYFPYMFRRI